MENRKKVFFIAISLLVIAVFGLSVLNSKGSESAKSGKYDTFAQCIKDSGATFYGTFWCPHCQNQKKMFGSSAKLLPYVECSTADAKGQTQICIDKNITGYPTWEFADGARLSGEVELSTLAEKTSCVLPQE